MHPAKQFIEQFFEPDDILNIVAADGKYGWEGVAVTALEAASDEFIAGLTAQNQAGKSIYFCVNPLKSTEPVEGKISVRSVQNIRTIKNIMLDVDVEAEKWFPLIQELTPAGYVQETSPGKLQKIWRIRNCDNKKFKEITDAFFGELGGDEKCGDICRLFRLPGFYNRKKAYADNPPLVTATQWVNLVTTPESFEPLLKKYRESRGMKVIADGKPEVVRDETILQLKIDCGISPAETRLGPLVLGQNFQCPFHDPGESSSQRSFGFVKTDEDYVIYRCHHQGCDAKGDMIDFVANFDGIPTGDAIRKVKKETYPNETEAKQISERAKLRNLPVIEPTKIVEQEVDLPAHPLDALTGDLIGELTFLLTTGTFIPPQFMRQNIKTALGHVLDGLIGFPGQPRLHTRRYSFLVGPPESGKGESWSRTNLRDVGCLDALLTFHNVTRMDGTAFGSGQFLAKQLAEHPNVILNFDEGRTLFEQAEMKGSTLESIFLSVFESNSVAQGSFKNGQTQADNVHLSLSGGFTEDSFLAAFGGRGSRGSGFLSRVELAAGVRVRTDGKDWPLIDLEAVKRVVDEMARRVVALGPRVGGATPFIPVEHAGARVMREGFAVELQGYDRDKISRLLSHFKRDLLLRAFFGPGEITEDCVRRSILWAKDQIALRERLWPDDKGGPIEIFERRVIAALTKHGPQSQRGLVKLCNVTREGSGGRELFNRAVFALQRSGEVEVVGQNRKKQAVFGLVKDEIEPPSILPL